MIYVLFLDTEFYDYDTHYDSIILGVYTTEKQAEAALERYEKIDILEKHIFMADEIDFHIEELEMDVDLYIKDFEEDDDEGGEEH